MAQNRIIHNVQDVFVGSTPSESDNLVTGVAGHEVLKRVDRVQSFNYSIDMPKEDALTLGKSKPFSTSSNQPPKVSLSLSCYANGVNNEKRMGFNTDNENENANDRDKTLFHDMLSEDEDKRNMYLVVNPDNEDIRRHSDPPYEKLLDGTFTENDIVDEKSPSYSVVVFQNCRLNSYNVKAGVGAIPTVDFDYSAQHMVGYVSGSGIDIPMLHIQDGTVTVSYTHLTLPTTPNV